MKMNESASLALRICLFAGTIVLVSGLVLSESDIGTDILMIGLLILAASPLVGVLVTYVRFISEKDWKWVKVSSMLILVITVSLLISFLE